MMREDVPAAGGQILPRLGMRCMRRRPVGETEIQLLRMPEPARREFSAVNSRKATEAIRMFVAWSLHRSGAELRERPAPQED